MTVAGRGAPPPRRPCVPWPARALLPAGRLPPSGPWSRRPRPRPRPPAGVACDGDGPPRHGTSALDVRPAPALRMRRPGAHRKIRVAHRGRECRGRAAQLSRHLADISRMNGPKPPLWSLCSPGQPRPSSDFGLSWPDPRRKATDATRQGCRCSLLAVAGYTPGTRRPCDGQAPFAGQHRTTTGGRNPAIRSRMPRNSSRGHRHLGHVEGQVASVREHLRTDLHHLLAQGG